MSDLSDKFEALQLQLGTQHTDLMLALAALDTSIQATTSAVGTMASDIVDRLNPSLDYLDALNTSITRMRKIMLADEHGIPFITLANGMSSSTQILAGIRDAVNPLGTGRPMPDISIWELMEVLRVYLMNTMGIKPPESPYNLLSLLGEIAGGMGGPPTSPEYAVLPMMMSLLESLDGVAANTGPSAGCDIGNPPEVGFDPLVYETIIWAYYPWIDVGNGMWAPLWPESVESYGVTRGPIMTQITCTDWTGFALIGLSSSCVWKWEPSLSASWFPFDGSFWDMQVTSGMIEPCVPSGEKVFWGLAVPVGAE